jgi:cytochrome c oxidase subunit II
MVIAATAAVGCGGPLSILEPHGPGAEPIVTLWWVMFWGSMVTLAIMSLLWLYPYFRAQERRPTISNRAFIIGGGVIWPLITVMALLTYGLVSGHKVLPELREERAFRVEVTGHRWWWEIRYPDFDVVLFDANEIHIPANRTVEVLITGADVIHSFWVPQLAGKLDAIPGQVNVLRLQANAPGLFRGHCAEFCGGQHARMSFYVEAHPPAALDARLDRLAGRSRDLDPVTQGGAAEFQRHCARCHSIDATQQGDQPAPNLAGLVDRRFLGAGTLVHDRDNLRRWIRDHQRIKPGNFMPDHSDLALPTIEVIARFLEHGE